MYKVGLVIPSSNTTMEPEFHQIMEPYATVHTSRLRLRKVTAPELEVMERDAERAACELSDADVDVICYGCTSGSLLRGIGHDKQLVHRIESATGIPAVATAGAVVDALRHLGLKRISVATPYTREINAIESRFLKDSGFGVLNILGLGLTENPEIGLQSAQVAYKLARRSYVADADGVFISCTNFHTLDVIAKLEDELSKPTVSSNTATAWKVCQKLRITNNIHGYGQLLALT